MSTGAIEKSRTDMHVPTYITNPILIGLLLVLKNISIHLPTSSPVDEHLFSATQATNNCIIQLELFIVFVDWYACTEGQAKR